MAKFCHVVSVARAPPLLSSRLLSLVNAPTCLIALVYLDRVLLAQLRPGVPRSRFRTQAENKTLSPPGAGTDAGSGAAPYPLAPWCCSGGTSPSWWRPTRASSPPAWWRCASRSSGASGKWMEEGGGREGGEGWREEEGGGSGTCVLLFICTLVTCASRLRNRYSW